MMNRILSLHLCFMMFFIANAETIQKGYHGFADVGYCQCTSDLAPAIIDVATSHGYQFSNYIFLGAGVGFDYTGKATWEKIDGRPYYKRDSSVDVPLFFNGRFNFTNTKLIPFLDLRAGTYINNEGGYFLNAMVGCRLNLSDNNGLSFSIGAKCRSVTAERLNYNKYKKAFIYEDKENESLEGLVFKIGFDF